MRWYTCILEVKGYLISYFHTKATSPNQAYQNAIKWRLDGEPSIEESDIDMFIFEGKLEPCDQDETGEP